MNIVKTELGYELKTPELTIFFGGVRSQTDLLREVYPAFKFIRLKQIHSDAIVESNQIELDGQVIADAHFTKAAHTALCVITADCVPVFFYDPVSKIVGGAHAGWRGVASRILPKMIKRMVEAGANLRSLEVVIGPHIQKSSFEVGFDVRDQILCSLGPLNSDERAFYSQTISDKKALVDLNQIVKAQLQSEGVELEKVADLHFDTFSNPEFHSHRRDKVKAGRQVSFICRTF